MKLLAFDIETAKITPEGEDIQNHRPLGISCWAIAWQDEGGNIGARSGQGEQITMPMSQGECQWLVDRLLFMRDMRGYSLVTHNGVSFDFDILAEESGYFTKCQSLAMRSVDTCFQVHCMKGFPVGLEAIAKGMNLSGKTEGMSGALAPQMWAEGKYDEVLAYVAQDACSTLEVALAIEKRRGLQWISKSGRRNTLAIPRLLTVEECLKLPEPNTSWMSDPIPREQFTGWMAREAAV